MATRKKSVTKKHSTDAIQISEDPSNINITTSEGTSGGGGTYKPASEITEVQYDNEKPRLNDFIIATVKAEIESKYADKMQKILDTLESINTLELSTSGVCISSTEETLEYDVDASCEFKFSKIRKVKSPERAHDTDAGTDFFIPDNSFESGFYDLKPNERILIPAGLKVKLPAGHALIFFNKSGVATKLGIMANACVIDENYEGEIHIGLCNTSNKITRIMNGMKIIQGILLKINYVKPVEVPLSDLYDTKSTRGEGGFGSTGV